MNQEIRLTINGIDITSIVVGQTFLNSAFGEGSSLETTLQLSSTYVDALDLRGEVVLEILIDGKAIRQFSGFIAKGNADGTLYKLSCIDPKLILQEARTGGAFGNGLLPGEVIFYLLSTVTPESVNKKFILSGKENKSIDECEWLFNKRRFTFIAPCPPCTLVQNSVDFGDVTVYIPQGQANIDDQLIAGSMSDGLPEEWQETEARIQFFVQAEGFLEAFEKGRKKLRSFIDFLSFGAHFSTPIYRSKNEVKLHNFERERALIEFSDPRWTYVRDLIPSQEPRYWMRWYAPHQRKEKFAITSNDPIIRLYTLFSDLFEEDEKYLTTRQRALINAVHALRNARQAQSTIDGVNFIWQCVEFLSAGFSIQELFTSKDRKALKRVASCLIDKRYKDASVLDKQQRSQRLEKRIGQLDLADLRDKWEAFCTEHKLAYSEADLKFLWETRKVRNDVLHGRSADIERKQVERAAVLLEKAIITALETDSQKF